LDSNPFNKRFTTLFAARLAEELGVPPAPASEGYAAVMRLVAGLNERANGDAAALTESAVRVLDSLFPHWLPPAFAFMFSRPMPRFAAWINALVTVAVTQWLMGPSKLSEDGTMTVEIERCRYLEESGCVGTCVNSCKTATETFFRDSMKLPLWIEPDFKDFSCKFKFGVEPPPVADQPSLTEPCFSTCPLAGAPATRVCRSIAIPRNAIESHNEAQPL
jgi:Beta-carotene isomerase D27-like, C-terminal